VEGSEALDRFVFPSSDHIRRVVTEYVRYSSRARRSLAIHAALDPYPELREWVRA
jgi:hypothetical protein